MEGGYRLTVGELQNESHLCPEANKAASRAALARARQRFRTVVLQLGKQAPALVMTGARVSTRDLTRPKPFHGDPCRHAIGVDAGVNFPLVRRPVGVVDAQPLAA